MYQGTLKFDFTLHWICKWFINIHFTQSKQNGNSRLVNLFIRSTIEVNFTIEKEVYLILYKFPNIIILDERCNAVFVIEV